MQYTSSFREYYSTGRKAFGWNVKKEDVRFVCFQITEQFRFYQLVIHNIVCQMVHVLLRYFVKDGLCLQDIVLIWSVVGAVGLYKQEVACFFSYFIYHFVTYV